VQVTLRPCLNPLSANKKSAEHYNIAQITDKRSRILLRFFYARKGFLLL